MRHTFLVVEYWYHSQLYYRLDEPGSMAQYKSDADELWRAETLAPMRAESTPFRSHVFALTI